MRQPPFPKIAVFAGPSLPESDRISRDGLVYLPAAARGDVEAAAREYDVVLLVDGVFHHDLAPSPKECYAALASARMFGAASMGALRAAECAAYGFTPLGAIARWYLREVIDGDDEVAVLTHPQTQEAVTVPLVNVRYVARLARRAGALSSDECAKWVERARAIYYMDRSWDDVLAAAPERARESLREIALRRGDLKRHDARFALATVLRYADRLARKTRHSAPVRLPQSVPKAPGTYDRAVPFAQTLRIVPEVRARYGITRLADTTLLDRTGIPTFSAMVPHSPDLLGVYNGKGLTREAALLSAVMEAAERQIGANVRLPRFRESLRRVAERLDLDAFGLRDDAKDSSVECVMGTELFSGDAVPVPVAMVECPWFGTPLLDVTSTNGLASGNNLTEAIYHALCELIERHAWSMYHVRCSFVPRLFLGNDAKDVALAPELASPTGDPTADRLVREIEDAGLSVRALVLREGDLPVTVLASIVEPQSDPPMAHMGLGCALSPAHALARALTEVVQSRAVDIQAAREDILRPGEDARAMGEHGRRLVRLPRDAWFFDLPCEQIRFDALPDRSTGDLAADVRSLLESLRAYGIESAVVVDLSPPDLPIAVVRAIVPGLETLMFSGHLGPRARALLNPFAVTV